MDVPIGAQVYCENELCGRSTQVVLNPVTNEVTHIVVEQDGSFPEDRMVPIEWLEASTPYQLILSCSRAELAQRERLSLESSSSSSGETVLDREDSSAVGLAVKQGAWVEAWDSYAGLVDEFLIDPRTCCVTHIVLRGAHLWGGKGIAIPLSAVSCIEEDRVRLRLSIDGVRELSSILTQQHIATSE
jgi:hypothetical protein